MKLDKAIGIVSRGSQELRGKLGGGPPAQAGLRAMNAAPLLRRKLRAYEGKERLFV